MITLRCPAKINLYLAIGPRDASGYHEIETVLARTSALEDLITVEPAPTLQIEFLPGYEIDPQKSTVAKALLLLEAHAGRPFLYKITVQKNIPPQSGLGGGASNAAAILLHINETEKLGLSSEQLMEIAAQIGMDVPFFVSGYEVALATHYGEKITPLPALPPDFQITLELTGHAVSTPDAYARWDATPHPPAPPSKLLLAALQNHYAPGVLTSLHNDFELITPECGPYGLDSVTDKTRHLCGSGGAVFCTNFAQ